jgi:hypothetical protein
MKDDTITLRGGCHCGRIAFEVEGPVGVVEECNCSICTKKGYFHWIVPRDKFRLLTPADSIATYSFNTRVAKHHFCPVCGVAPFYIPRSDPERIDVNVRSLKGIDTGSLRIERFDGRNWERAYHERRGSGS